MCCEGDRAHGSSDAAGLPTSRWHASEALTPPRGPAYYALSPPHADVCRAWHWTGTSAAAWSGTPPVAEAVSAAAASLALPAGSAEARSRRGADGVSERPMQASQRTWPFSPGSLEASYAGLGEARALAVVPQSPPPLPPPSVPLPGPGGGDSTLLPPPGPLPLASSLHSSCEPTTVLPGFKSDFLQMVWARGRASGSNWATAEPEPEAVDGGCEDPSSFEARLRAAEAQSGPLQARLCAAEAQNRALLAELQEAASWRRAMESERQGLHSRVERLERLLQLVAMEGISGAADAAPPPDVEEAPGRTIAAYARAATTPSSTCCQALSPRPPGDEAGPLALELATSKCKPAEPPIRKLPDVDLAPVGSRYSLLTICENLPRSLCDAAAARAARCTPGSTAEAR